MNRSPLTCIFRVAGTDLDVDTILSGAAIQPYRVDRAGLEQAKINALHYDISTAETVSSTELEAAIEAFLVRNQQDILFIRQTSAVEQFVLDVALTIDDEMAMRTLTLSLPLMRAIVAAGLSFEISVYGGGPG